MHLSFSCRKLYFSCLAPPVNRRGFLTRLTRRRPLSGPCFSWLLLLLLMLLLLLCHNKTCSHLIAFALNFIPLARWETYSLSANCWLAHSFASSLHCWSPAVCGQLTSLSFLFAACGINYLALQTRSCERTGIDETRSVIARLQAH